MVICPNCLTKFNQEHTYLNKIKRRELILSNLNQKIRAERLFRLCRIKGYPMKRKTFQRDLQEMNKANLLRVETKRCKKRGLTTEVSSIKRQKKI